MFECKHIQRLFTTATPPNLTQAAPSGAWPLQPLLNCRHRYHSHCLFEEFHLWTLGEGNASLGSQVLCYLEKVRKNNKRHKARQHNSSPWIQPCLSWPLLFLDTEATNFLSMPKPLRSQVSVSCKQKGSDKRNFSKSHFPLSQSKLPPRPVVRIT